MELFLVFACFLLKNKMATPLFCFLKTHPKWPCVLKYFMRGRRSLELDLAPLDLEINRTLRDLYSLAHPTLLALEYPEPDFSSFSTFSSFLYFLGPGERNGGGRTFWDHWGNTTFSHTMWALHLLSCPKLWPPILRLGITFYKTCPSSMAFPKRTRTIIWMLSWPSAPWLELLTFLMTHCRLHLFPFSLNDKATDWFNSLESNSIESWAQMEAVFLKKYFSHREKPTH